MGALFGGVMEYNSMYFGFASLYLLALGFYSLAWVFSRKSGTFSWKTRVAHSNRTLSRAGVIAILIMTVSGSCAQGSSNAVQ